MMISYEILASQNPWWKGKENLKKDEDYLKWDEKKHKWVPSFIDRMELKPYSLHFLFGPRQVGKTTSLKLLIKKLLESGVREEGTFYFRCDEVADFKELSGIIMSYLDLRERLSIKSSYIFLDEITFPKEWYRSVKSLIDAGKLKKDVMVLTGSTSLLVKKEVETFPGRRGHGKDFTLLPLSFRDFIKIADKGLHTKLPLPLKTLAENEIKQKTAACLSLLDELNALFEKYIRCGGFPLCIESFLEKGEVERAAHEAYLAWLKNDIAKVGRSVNIARAVLKVLLTKIPSPVSWESIAKEIEIKSPKTVSAYVHLLNSLFVTLTLHHIDPHKASISFGKNKKIHFLDPFFFDLFSRWCLVELKDVEPKIVESTVASHLARFSSRGGELGENVFYWRNKGEIDVVVSIDGLKGFEVKWGERARVKPRILGKMKQLVFLSRDTFAEKPLVAPVSAFLACLDV